MDKLKKAIESIGRDIGTLQANQGGALPNFQSLRVVSNVCHVTSADDHEYQGETP